MTANKMPTTTTNQALVDRTQRALSSLPPVVPTGYGLRRPFEESAASTRLSQQAIVSRVRGA